MKKIIFSLLFCFLSVQAFAQNADLQSINYGISFPGFFVNIFQTGGSLHINTRGTGLRQVSVLKVDNSTSYQNQQNIRYVTLHMGLGPLQVMPPQKPGVRNSPVVLQGTTGDLKKLTYDTYVTYKVVLKVVDQNNQLLFYQVVWDRNNGIIFKQPIYPQTAGTYTDQKIIYPTINR